MKENRAFLVCLVWQGCLLTKDETGQLISMTYSAQDMQLPCSDPGILLTRRAFFTNLPTSINHLHPFPIFLWQVNMFKNKYLSLALFVVTPLFLFACSDSNKADSTGMTPVLLSSTSIQSTDSSTDGTSVVWSAKLSAGSQTRIFFQKPEGTAAPQVISPDVGWIDGGDSLWHVVVHDNLVVWRAWDGASYRIYAYDLSDASPEVVDISGAIESVDVFHTRGRIVVWVGNNNIVHCYNFDTDEQVDFPVTISDSDPFPKTDGRFVTWMAGLWPTFDIYVCDLDADSPTPIKLTNGGWNAHPVVHNGIVAWYGGGGGSSDEIYYADANGASPAVVRVTNNSVADDYPQISDGIIVWAASDGTDNEIYYYDTQAASPHIVKVTDNTTNDGLWPSIPRIENDLIVWSGVLSGVTGSEIFYYDLQAENPKVVRLTDNALDDQKPRVSGGMISWIAGGETYAAWQ